MSSKTTTAQNRIFDIFWYAVNILLVLSFLSAIYSGFWEYSTRRYLDGFSDAIIPADSTPQEEIDAILIWMARGPKRENVLLPANLSNRDPKDTLNYEALLKVCGSATNAFINLADRSDLSARRLLLLDSRHLTKHAVAEVLIDGRWIVVDPAFRQVLRNSNGVPATREELLNPAVFRAATSNITGYDPDYTYDHAAHIRVARLGLIAAPLSNVLDYVLPGWEGSVSLSLILERESLAAFVISFALVIFLALIRIGLRWYGERRLGLGFVRIRQQARRALYAFFDAAR